MGELLCVSEMTLRIEDDEERVCATKYAALVGGYAELHVRTSRNTYGKIYANENLST